MSELKIPWKNWEIVRKIGQGGYGTVYEIARTDFHSVEERAAMKVIRFPQDDSTNRVLLTEGYTRESIRSINREHLDHILDEYSLMIKMKGHRNIVRCDDCDAVPHDDEMGWDVFIRMEFLKTLHQKLEEGKLAEAEIITLGKDLCRALMQCEQYGIVHRDIKPENIFVNEYGDYKLGDFGISRTMEHTMTATRTGSYKFMAPEVFKGLEYGQTVDIYSLGLVLYWLLNSYRMPFMTAESIPSYQENTNALQRRLSGNEELPMPASGSKELKAVVMKACSYQPEDRYPSAKDFFDALEAVSVASLNSIQHEQTSNTSTIDFEYHLFDGIAGNFDEDDTIPAIDRKLLDIQTEDVDSQEKADTDQQHETENSELTGTSSHNQSAQPILSWLRSLYKGNLLATIVIILASLVILCGLVFGKGNALSDVHTGKYISVTIKSISPSVAIYDNNSEYYQAYLCKCITKDGDIVWIRIPRRDYKKHFDGDVITDVHVKYNARKIKLSPLRKITGTVERTGKYVGGSSSKIVSDKILIFDDVS